MDAALRSFVRRRAGHRCEYCRLHEDDADFLAFHVEHVIAKQHGGTDDPELLCYACSECNWAKGPNLSGILRGKLYPLFNPRRQNWTRHFYWDHTTLVGKTKTGMVTVQVLNINDPSRVMLRENLLFEERFSACRINAPSLLKAAANDDTLLIQESRGGVNTRNFMLSPLDIP